MDTIFAVSSGRPPAAIAIIRLSGPQAFASAEALAGTLPEPRRAGVRTLRDNNRLALDQALVLTFPGPRSATGEDVVEFHCHGGRAVVDAIERALDALPGMRRADAGEFTRRALTNGRIDLAQAEGLGDLLTAETEGQRRAAMAATEGVVSRAIVGWLDRLSILAAEVEAALDFADEDDVGDTNIDSIVRGIAGVAEDIRVTLDAPPVERLRDGVRVVLAGPPNSGKSTLLNRLAQRDAAIVTPISGTTRDRIDVSVVRDGVAYVLTDTAGLTDTDDIVERIGVERATAAIDQADILVWLGDDEPPRDAIWVHARADQPDRVMLPAHADLAIGLDNDRSLNDLWQALAIRLVDLLPAPDTLLFSRNQRRRCADAIVALTMDDQDLLIIAERLRRARKSLSAILGVDATEAMLTALFSRFCIGK